MKTKIFYDFEATSVSRDADMISVGLVAVTEYDMVLPNKVVNGISDTLYRTKKMNEVKTFYSEFTDFSLDKCADWVKENVVSKLHLKSGWNYWETNEANDKFICRGTTEEVKTHLKEWLSQFEEIEFWADYDNKDRTYLQELIGDWTNYIIGGVPDHLPNVKYDQFFDLHTLFKIKGIDTDISREEFSEVRQQVIPLPFSDCDKSHNALFDAYVSWLCYNKLMKI